jgi:dipeptidyl aminopeptidase/acylaminoacyl peptidase/glycine cleavage system pyridoxal-binding protein P
MTHDLAALAGFDQLGEFSVHPAGDRLTYVSRAGDLPAVWLRPLHPDAEPRRLWSGEAVQRCVWRPDGRRVLVQTDPDGRENYQLHEIDPDSGEITWSTGDPKVRYEIGPVARTGNQPYSDDGALLAFASNARDRRFFDVAVRDVATGRIRTVLVAEDRYYPVSFSPDGRLLLVIRMRQNTDHDLYTCDLDTGTVTHVTPHDGPARYVPGPWAADGGSVYLATTQDRDLAGLGRLDLTPEPVLRWLATPPHEVDHLTRSGPLLLWAVNRDGYTELRVRNLDDGDGGQDRPVRTPPGVVLARDMGRGPFAPQFAGDRTIVTGVGRPTAPTELCRIDLDSGLVTALTRCGRAVPAPGTLVEPSAVRYPSTDGLTIPALLYRPAGAGPASPAPVVVSVHGGPEVQALPLYDPLIQHLVGRGIGVIQPNYRGSSGYGLAHQRAIYRDFGGGDLRDLAMAARYLATLGWVDPGRLGVCGGSYGGFATLSCLTRQPDLWTVAVDHCGRSDLTRAAVPPHWRARLREWMGDPEEDAASLRQRSPLTHAHRAVAPLLVIHGENDTRVPKSESDRMVRRLRELGKPVEYLVIEGGGHDASSRQDALTALEATAGWLARHLLTEPAEPAQPAHPYVPQSEPVARRRMLDTLGLSGVADLYADIPPDLRLDRDLDLPPALTAEADLERHVAALLDRNTSTREALSFLGGGCYQYHVPAVCDEINARSEFLTAYAGTAHEDHGRFQALFEYQSMLGELLEMDVVTLPLYDGYQASASALRMAGRITGRSRVLIGAATAPDKLRRIADYLGPTAAITMVPTVPDTGTVDLAALAALLDDRVSAVLLETPNHDGAVETGLAAATELAHAAGALSVASCDPIALGVLAPPAAAGADIACGDIQSLGIHQNFGGGQAGFLAVHDHEEIVRELPARIFGIARTRVDGEYGFGDIAFDRTSFARRENGKEWVGTAANLWGITAGVYLALLGPVGLRELGETILHRTRYAKARLARIDGLALRHPHGIHFREFVADLTARRPAAEVTRELATRHVFVGHLDGDGPPALRVCVTERHTKDDIDRLATLLEEVL